LFIFSNDNIGSNVNKLEHYPAVRSDVFKIRFYHLQNKIHSFMVDGS